MVEGGEDTEVEELLPEEVVPSEVVEAVEEGTEVENLFRAAEEGEEEIVEIEEVMSIAKEAIATGKVDKHLVKMTLATLKGVKTRTAYPVPYGAISYSSESHDSDSVGVLTVALEDAENLGVEMWKKTQIIWVEAVAMFRKWLITALAAVSGIAKRGQSTAKRIKEEIIDKGIDVKNATMSAEQMNSFYKDLEAFIALDAADGQGMMTILDEYSLLLTNGHVGQIAVQLQDSEVPVRSFSYTKMFDDAVKKALSDKRAFTFMFMADTKLGSKVLELFYMKGIDARPYRLSGKNVSILFSRALTSYAGDAYERFKKVDPLFVKELEVKLPRIDFKTDVRIGRDVKLLNEINERTIFLAKSFSKLKDEQFGELKKTEELLNEMIKKFMIAMKNNQDNRLTPDDGENIVVFIQTLKLYKLTPKITMQSLLGMFHGIRLIDKYVNQMVSSITKTPTLDNHSNGGNLLPYNR
jgi:hypothetical protein